MRALDFILENTEVLDEVAMNPTRLKQEAAKTGARAGMEFEMIVPNVSSEDNDSDPEPDYDSDESTGSISNISNFFLDNEYNGRREVEHLVSELTDSYHEWADEKRSEQWDSEGKDYLREYIENEGEFDEDEALEEAYDQLGLTDEQKEKANKAGATITKHSEGKENEDWRNWKEAQDLVSEKLDQFVEEQWDERGRLYDNAYEKWFDEADWPDESDWLESQGLYTMQDVESNYAITWPHWYYPNQGGELSIDDVADEFSRMIGKPINASQRYHGARREAGHYVVEPDGSLEPDDYDDSGLEFVSPPMPIDEMLSDFNKVVAWAKDKGCYTNDSTGLHINVSVPDFSRDKLDYVKLAILLGDEYVLKEFDREGNTYCKSALKRVKDNIRSRPEDAKQLLDKMKSGLSDIASKAVHSGATDKYTSINTKDGYIEFRSPGGDWLDADIPKVENTLLRFVVALDAACDPQKYRKEYLTKLYKLLSPSKDATDTIQYFARYAAGELPKAALRSFVKQAQLERKVKAEKEGSKKYWWKVTRPGYGASVEVVASSKEEAIEKGKKEYPDWSRAQDIDAKPVRKFEEPTLTPYDPDGNYIISKFKADGPNTVAYRFKADTLNDAEMVLKDWLTANNITDRADPVRGIHRQYSIRYDPTKAQGQAEGYETTNQPKYEIFNLNTGNSVEDAEGITNDRDALIRLNDYLEHGPHRLTARQARDMFGIRRVGGDGEPILAQPIRPLPGSTLDLQRQRAQGSFTGAWKVTVDGEEVYRFSGIGNNQADANRIGREWARNQISQGLLYPAGDIEVVPVMG